MESMQAMMIQTWALAQQQEGYIDWDCDECRWVEEYQGFTQCLALTDNGFVFNLYSASDTLLLSQPVTRLSEVRELFSRDWVDHPPA